MKKIIFFLVLFSACKSGDDNNAKPDTVSPNTVSPNTVYVKTWNNLSGDIHVTTDNLVEGTTNKYFKTNTKVTWSQVYGYPIFATKGSADSLGWLIKNSNVDFGRVTNHPVFATKSSVDSLAAKVVNGNGGISYTKDESNQIFLFRSEYIPGVSKQYMDSVIVANKGNVDLSNYYTIPQINAGFAPSASVAILQGSVSVLQGTIASLQSNVISLQSTIAAQKTWIDSVKNATLPEAFYTIPDASTITYDCKNGFNQSVTVAGTRTINVINDAGGKYYTLVVYQNGSGAYDINAPTGDKFMKGIHNGNKIFLNHDNNGMTTITFFRKGGVRVWSKGDYE
jgi:hypothetical protein